MKKQRAINLLVLIVAIVLLFTVGCSDEESTVVNANEITAFEMTDWIFGETPSTPSVTATYGADTAKFYYATAEERRLYRNNRLLFAQTEYVLS